MADGVVPTLELIDNSIRDHETSIDAMRWAPDGFAELAEVTLPRVEVRFEIRPRSLDDADVQAALRGERSHG